jgi:hypothetical protein
MNYMFVDKVSDEMENQDVEVSLNIGNLPINGTLTFVDETGIVVEARNNSYAIPWQTIALIRKVIRW